MYEYRYRGCTMQYRGCKGVGTLGAYHNTKIVAHLVKVMGPHCV